MDTFIYGTNNICTHVPQVIVLDEATANVDLESDRIIQATIRTRFRDCTVLVIAHRINTIIDADMVAVIDQGRLVEYASPYQLLTGRVGDLKEGGNGEGIFRSMVKECGEEVERELLAAAQSAHTARGRLLDVGVSVSREQCGHDSVQQQGHLVE